MVIPTVLFIRKTKNYWQKMTPLPRLLLRTQRKDLCREQSVSPFFGLDRDLEKRQYRRGKVIWQSQHTVRERFCPLQAAAWQFDEKVIRLQKRILLLQTTRSTER